MKLPAPLESDSKSSEEFFPSKSIAWLLPKAVEVFDAESTRIATSKPMRRNVAFNPIRMIQ